MSANPKQNAPRVAPPPSTLAGIGDAHQTGAVSTGRAPVTASEPTPAANPRIWAFPLVAKSDDLGDDYGNLGLLPNRSAKLHMAMMLPWKNLFEHV